MSFFLLLWILGATTEKQRKSIADYFAPTLVALRENSAGSNGLFGGETNVDRDHYQPKAPQTGTRALPVPVHAGGGPDAGRRPDRTIPHPPRQRPAAAAPQHFHAHPQPAK